MIVKRRRLFGGGWEGLERQFYPHHDGPSMNERRARSTK